jgi:hypothetical protein
VDWDWLNGVVVRFQLFQSDHALQMSKNSMWKLVHALEAHYDPRLDPTLELIGKLCWPVQTSYAPKIIAGVQIMVVAET